MATLHFSQLHLHTTSVFAKNCPIMSYPLVAPLFEWSPWKTILEFAARAHQSTTTFVTEHSVSGNHGQLSAVPECKSAVHFLASKALFIL